MTTIESRPYYSRANAACEALLDKFLRKVEPPLPKANQAAGLTPDRVNQLTRKMKPIQTRWARI